MLKINKKTFLLLSLAIGLVFRLQHVSKVFRGETILFNGYDSYYHLRLAEIIVNTGRRIEFDSYLNYPYGLKINWLPLYHWLISLPGIVFGFRATEVFAAFLPVVLGLISVIVIYMIAVEVFQNEYVALISAFLSALTPKLVSIHSVGSSDYHGWNVTLFLIAVLFFIRGLRANHEERNLGGYGNFILSGTSLAFLAGSWLGGSIYALIIALLAMIAIRRAEMDYYRLTLVFLPPTLAALLVSPPNLFQAQLALPYLGIFVFLFFFLAANSFAEKKAVSVKSKNSIELEKGKKRGKHKKAKAQVNEREEERLIAKYKNIASSSLIVIAILILFGLYITSFRPIRVGINYILGISPYLQTIAEARALQLPIVVLDSGMMAFLLAIPFSIYGLLKTESNSKYLNSGYLFILLISTFALSMLQIRFDEVFVPFVSIYSAYGICYLLQASNIPVLHQGRKEKDERRGKDKKDGEGKAGKAGGLGKGKTAKSGGSEGTEVVWGKVELAYSAVIILFIASTGAVFSVTQFDLTEDWLSSLNELREVSPQTSGYLDPVEKPEYSILSWWDYGNWILYIAKRPVVCNNFQAGAKDAAVFFTTSNETLAKEVLKRRGVRYIVTDEGMTLGNETFRGKFQAIMRIAGLDTKDSNFVLDTYKNSMFYKLHIENGVEGIRLLSHHGSVKVFEVRS